VKPARQNNSLAIQRLTALWALCESGLGGWMHALKIPLTGFLVGGFAVVIISLIAWYSERDAKQILRSTLLVILVKAAVSPQSPLPAYVAVAFQGCIGALLYSSIPYFRFTSVLFAIVAMLESALQMLLITTLLFGKSVWQALDLFFEDLVKNFHLPGNHGFSFWIIIAYTSVYTLWGLLIGIWAGKLPERISQELNKYDIEAIRSQTSLSLRDKKSYKKPFLFVAICAFVVMVFFSNGNMNKVLYVIVRTLAVLLLFFGLINPLIRYLLHKWFRRENNKNAASVKSIIDMMPELSGYFKPAYILSKKNKRIKRYTSFLFLLIVFTLQPVNND